jgi:two-component system response regulator RstA
MTVPPPARLLLVEDDARTAALVREYLETQGFHVDHEPDGARAAQRIVAERPDLVILDLMLPGKDGLTVCREVRPAFPGPILMITARGDEVDQVVGLELGADDYVAKPVGPRLLVARIRALLRRPARVGPVDRVDLGALVLDRARREVKVEGALVALTTAEFDLLWVLASRAGEVVRREELFEALRGIPYDGFDRSMDMRVSAVRRRIERGQPWIKTVRGEGYLLVPPDAAAPTGSPR